MGSLVLYIMEWAFALIILLTIYKAVFSGTTFYRFNRFYLLGATVLSALLPLVHITIPEKTPVVSGMAISDTEFAQELSGTFAMMSEPQMEIMAPAQSDNQSKLWSVILVCMYSGYVLMLMIGWIRSIIRARRFLRGKPRRRISRTVWLVTHDEEFGPFSWMNYIVISDTENGFARRASLRHEYSHVKLLHSVDLIFLLACTIFNPVCWLVLQEIKIVHEYEADHEVISHHGIRNGDYQKLLIMRTVGAEAYALASSFNLNIKKRINMLNKNQTRKRRLMWLLILIPALGITSVLFARTEKTVGPDDVLNLSKSDYTDGVESAENNTSFEVSGKVVDQDGNPIAYVEFNVIPETSGIANLTKCLSDNNGEFAYSTRKGEIVTVSKKGYVPIKVTFEGPTSDLAITLKKTNTEATIKAGDIITGVVVDADDGAPMMLVDVYEKDANNRIKAHGVTDIDGNFAIRVVDPNDYLSVSFKGYIEDRRPISSGQILLRSMPEPKKQDYMMVVDDQPEFPGGTFALLEYLRENIKYPADARENNIQGRVIVSFIVDTLGNIKDAEVVKSIYPSIDKEALRVISAMPAWTPGKDKGKLVNVKYTIPISFRYDDPSDAKTPEWILVFGTENTGINPDPNPGGMKYAVERLEGMPQEGTITTPENIESDIKDLFDGKKNMVIIKNSDENYQKVKAVLNDYSDKHIIYLD